jgi:transitional endoplasmic reticulum ATPase
MKSKLFEVVEAKQGLREKNLVSLSSLDMESLNISSGDLVRIGNNKKMILRVVRVGEDSSGKIGLDGETRSTLGILLGEKIEIELFNKHLDVLKSVEISVLENEDISSEELKESIIPSLKDKRNEVLFRNSFVGTPVCVGQKTSLALSNGGRLVCSISRIFPKDVEAGFLGDSTKIIISDSIGGGSGVNIHYEDIGGLDEEISKIREMVEFPMKHPKIFEKLGISAPKGVLLTGPPGTGKTLLAKAVATETDAKFVSIAGPEIMSKYHGGSEENLRAKFEEAQKNAPAIIFIDEVDAIAPKRGETHDQAEKRVVTQLLTLMDGLKSRGQVVVMAATNRPEDLDEALRRPGRFDREIKINPPTEKGRREILDIHTRKMPIQNREELLAEIANKTMGFTGADLEVLCKEAALHSVKPFYKEIMKLSEEMQNKGMDENKSESSLKNKEEKEIMQKRDILLSNLIVKREDFVYAMRMVEPSAMREVLINKPDVKWTDVGGLDEAKEKLKELIELPLLRPDLYAQAGIKPNKGVLLTGPSGTGKTLLAKAVANESNANFISVKGPELISKWVGESEKHVRDIFKKAKQVSPAIIFFDEFDSISKSRGVSCGNDASEKVVNQLLTELDGVEDLENVMVIAATNRPDLIDPALLRPGRIDSIVRLNIPDKQTRIKIFEVHTKKMPLAKSVNLSYYVDRTEGWTGAEIESLCRNAGITAIKKYASAEKTEKLVIEKEDFEESFKSVSNSTGKISSNDLDSIDKKDVLENINVLKEGKNSKKNRNLK